MGLRGWDLSFEAGIWALRLGFEPWGLDLSLKARIWTSRGGWVQRRRRRRRRNFCICESIGHRPLRGCCPKTRIYDAAIGIICVWVCWRAVGGGIGVKLGDGCPCPSVRNNIVTSRHLSSSEAISNQSCWWRKKKKAVLWEITVRLFINQFGQKSCYSERIFPSPSNAANRVFQTFFV